MVICLGSSGITAENACWTIGRIKYSGGGDWYADPTSLPNLLARVKKDLGANVCNEEKTVTLLDGSLYDYPVLYLTGHGNIFFSEEERRALREYLFQGGLLVADDNYGLDSSFRREMHQLFKNRPLYELNPKHPVFSSFYNFPKGLPKIHQHDGKRPQAFGIDLEDRTVVFYSYECDLGDGWENQEVHNVTPHLREKSLKMGVNIIAWLLQGQMNQAQQ
ncbi:MAG: DUF4159 domain-containing protein [Fibrobacteria bacterium]|nr:DUF4159 domain-containing protein [Fibrobacteria bacterium]